MIRKNTQVQLAIYAIMIGVIFVLININSPFEILGINFIIPTIWFWSLSLTFFAPIFVLIILEFFVEGVGYDNSPFVKMAKGCWHLFFLAVGVLIFAIMAMIALVYLSKISSFWLSLILIWIIISFIIGKIKTFFKKKNINIFNPFTWVR